MTSDKLSLTEQNDLSMAHIRGIIYYKNFETILNKFLRLQIYPIIITNIQSYFTMLLFFCFFLNT